MAVKDPIVIREAFDWRPSKSRRKSPTTSEASCRRLSDSNDGSANALAMPGFGFTPARSPRMVDGDQEPHIGTRTATSITDSEPLMHDPSRPSQAPLHLQSYDGALGRKIIDLHIWAVQQGLRGASTDHRSGSQPVGIEKLPRRAVSASLQRLLEPRAAPWRQPSDPSDQDGGVPKGVPSRPGLQHEHGAP